MGRWVSSRWSVNLIKPKIYWETTRHTFVQVRFDSIPRNSFERILRNVHLCDNEQRDKEDKFSKILLVINKSNKIFLKIFFSTGKAVANKLIQEEQKTWLFVAEPYGYVVQFRLHQGT